MRSEKAEATLETNTQQTFTSSKPELSRTTFVRVAFWTVAFLLGAAQTWAVRHNIFSDGISYIEIAKAYARGDWSMAINPYWSPLYSWLLMLAYQLLRPAPYWEVAVLHLVNFIEFLLCLGAAEYFVQELLRFRRAIASERELVPDFPIRIAAYCTILFAGLSMVNMWYCSPDMIAMGLILTLSGQLLRLSFHGPSTWLSIGIGVVCALSFLARTAFAPIFVISLAICAFLIYRSRGPVWKHTGLIAACVVILCGPFVAAISVKEGKFTIGESGALNYGWEIDGAARYAHWQGEPFDIGRPKHPTIEATIHPRSYVLSGPVPGTYAPWFNPAYWYDGIKPKLKIKPQLEILAVNLSVLTNLTVRSAAFLCLIPLVFLTGWRSWFERFSQYWPVLLPSLAVIAMYCLVYIEKRYIAGNLVVLWMTALTSVTIRSAKVARFATALIVALCLLYTGVFVVRRQTGNVAEAASDLFRHREKFQNVQALIAAGLERAGLRAGDKVAYIGPSVDADWARLAGVKIVAEIPLSYQRNRRLLNNTLIDKADDIKRFWTDPGPGRAAVIDVFRHAGAKMIVTDGYFDREFVNSWTRVLPVRSEHYRDDDAVAQSQVNTRYVWLSELPQHLTSRGSPDKNSTTDRITWPH